MFFSQTKEDLKSAGFIPLNKQLIEKHIEGTLRYYNESPLWKFVDVIHGCKKLSQLSFLIISALTVIQLFSLIFTESKFNSLDLLSLALGLTLSLVAVFLFTEMLLKDYILEKHSNRSGRETEALWHVVSTKRALDLSFPLPGEVWNTLKRLKSIEQKPIQLKVLTQDGIIHRYLLSFKGEPIGIWDRFGTEISIHRHFGILE